MKFPLVLTLAFCALASDVCTEYLPPEPALVVANGCTIQQYKAPDDYWWWHVYVWTKDVRGREWRRLFSIREIDQRKKALDDCELWLRCLEKTIKKARRTR